MSKIIVARSRLPRLSPARDLVEQTVTALRQSILAGNFADHDNLPSQGELSEQLGVSRPVVREATRILQSQGLLRISQGRKPQVQPAGPQAMIESLNTLLERADVALPHLAEARVPLESEIAGLAAERAQPEDLRALRQTIHDLKVATNLEARVQADVDFHRRLAQATRNPIFEWLLEALAKLLRESRRRTIRLVGAEVALAHHTHILRAVESGDGKAARKAMRDHLEAARSDIARSTRKLARRG